MRTREVFDRELGEARAVYGSLQLSYDLAESRMERKDNNSVYGLLSSVGSVFEGLDQPLGHPDVQVSIGVKEERDKMLDSAKIKLEETKKILSKYDTSLNQKPTQQSPRIIARTSRYGMDDRGGYYAMTDGRAKRPITSPKAWKAGDVPVKISSEIAPSDLSQRVTLHVVSGKPGFHYPVKVEHRDQDGDPFFVYEMEGNLIAMILNPDKGKWKGTVQEDFVQFDHLPTDVQKALLGEETWERRVSRGFSTAEGYYGESL